MSTPSRGRGGGSGRGTTMPTTRSRGSGLRSRGRGRGSSSTPGGGDGTGLLQKMRTGTVQRSSEAAVTTKPTRTRGTAGRGQTATSRRGGRGAFSHTINTPPRSTATASASVSATPASSYRDFMAHMNEKFQVLKPKRDAERKKAIQDGFLADPDKKTSLANAITPVGTCTEMCPEFERIERIVQNMVDKAEKVLNESLERDLPAEDRMIKRFRRSAAGYDEQLPSDIRTPETLRRTLDYLLDNVIGGGERLASIHKFVWDRTRGIRNDFSIQQVTKSQDVAIAVDCFERIARFHILSLHQLSNPNNLLEGENFDAHQEREQLNNTLLSLMYYYDDNRKLIPLPNEAEFRSYCILFELQALTPDLEERMQSWPQDLLNSPKIQTAFKVYAAAGNTVFDQGPLRPLVPFSIGQANSGRFWTLLASNEVSYMMACVAEMNFSMVRFTALDALWRSGKSAPLGQQQRNQEWTMGELTDYLGFDDEEQTLEFVEEFGLAFGTSSTGEQYLDFTVTTATSLDRSSIPSQQVFSHEVVERKRWHRTLVAVINGLSVATAIREGLVIEQSSGEVENDSEALISRDDSLFIPDQTSGTANQFSSASGSQLNPQASLFQPSSVGSTTLNDASKPFFTTKFGESTVPSTTQAGFKASPVVPAQAVSSSQNLSTIGFGTPSNVFGQNSNTQAEFGQTQNPFQKFHTSPNVQGTEHSSQPTFTFGQQNPTFTPSASSSSTPSNKAPHKTASLMPMQAAGPNPMAIGGDNSAQAPASPLGTFFGEKSLKQQTRTSDVLSQPAATQQISLPTFNFGQPSVSPSVEKQAMPQTISPSVPVLPHQAAIPSETNPASIFAQSQTPIKEMKPSASLINSSAVSTDGVTQPTLTSSMPVFNFNQSSNTSISKPQSKPHEVAPQPAKNSQSTTPLSSPRRPQLQDFKFPSSKDSQSQIVAAPDATSTSPTSTTPKSSSPRTPLPTASHNDTSDSQPPSSTLNKPALAETVARLALNQPQGLLEYFIGNQVSRLLQGVVKEYQKDIHETIISYVKTRYLARKYFACWRQTTRRNVLSRRGSQRRKLLAAAMQAELDKHKRNEEELEAILAATQETKKLQQEVRERQEEAAQSKADRKAKRSGTSHQIAGTKRKDSARTADNRLSSGSTTTVGKSHKRSRTFGSFSESSTSTRLSSPSSHAHPSAAAAGLMQSYFGRSGGSQQFRQSLTSHKVDTTKTDYFKLKAMGIDPETPLIPDTARGLALRQQRQEEERQALVSRIRGRGKPTSRASTPVQPTNDMPPPPRPLSTAVQSSPIRPPSSDSIVSNDDDEFLRSLREAREAMSKDEEWFKTAAASLESEMQQQEQFRRSQGSQPSVTSRRSSLGGMAKANGYDYYAAEIKPGTSLSRTERRIRATGAHGLATKPIDKGVSSASPQEGLNRNKSVELRNEDFHDLSTPSKKRERHELDQSARSPPSQPYAVKRSRGEERSFQHKSQRNVGGGHAKATSSNMFASLSHMDSAGEELQDNADDEDDLAEVQSEADEEIDASDMNGELYQQNLQSMSEEELVEEDEISNGDEDEEEDDDEEDEEDLEDEEDDTGFQPSPTSSLKYPNLSQGPTSTFDKTGPGHSADDALVLSD